MPKTSAKVNGAQCLYKSDDGTTRPLSGLEIAQEAYDGMSPIAQQSLPAPKQENAKEFSQALMKFTAVANEFAGALVNRIMFSWVKGAEAYDPLDFLRRGNLGPGYTVEEIYADMLEAKDWDEYDDYVADIFRSVTPKVYALYHSVNFQKTVDVTTQNDILARGFTNWADMETLAAQIVNQLYETMRDAEYQQTKALLATAYAGGLCYPVTVTPVDINAPIDKDAMETNTVKIRAAVGRLKFAKRDYNYMGVKNRTTIDDILFITTPDYIAAQDVKVLAAAFNMSRADFLGRVVEVDDFGGAEKNGAVGFIIDREWFQIYRTLEKMTEQYNYKHLSWNYSYTVNGIFSMSLFSNCIVLVDSSKLDTIESVEVTAGQSAPKKASTLINATVTAADDSNKYHYDKLIWSISGNSSDKTVISPYGMLTVGNDETAASINVTVKSQQDDTKTDTKAVTITGG